MRIAVNVEQLLSRSPGGIGRYSGQLATLLASLPPADEVVPFVARHRRADVDRVLGAGLPPDLTAASIILPWPRPLLYEAWNRWGFPPLTLGARGLGAVDVVHAPSAAVPPRRGTPLVVTLHDAASELWPDAFTPRGRRFHALGAAAAARRADLVITVSRASADEIAARTSIPAGRIRVVPHGIDPPVVTDADRDDARRRHGLTDGPFVLWVGSLEPRKDVGTLVAAMARLHRLGATTAPLVLVGPEGWLTSGLIDPADRAVLGGQLRILGRLDEVELWALYGAASLLALPSRHEGFGLPLLEAMSQGTAVVCSDLPVTREVAGGAAIFVPVGDVPAWSEAIIGLLGDPAALAARSDAGRARAAGFGVDALVAGTRAVYHEVIGH